MDFWPPSDRRHQSKKLNPYFAQNSESWRRVRTANFRPNRAREHGFLSPSTQKMLKGFFNFRYSHDSYRGQLVTLIRLKQKLGLKIEVIAQVDQFSKIGVLKKVKIFSIRDHHFNRLFLNVILVVSDRSEIEYFSRSEIGQKIQGKSSTVDTFFLQIQIQPIPWLIPGSTRHGISSPAKIRPLRPFVSSGWPYKNWIFGLKNHVLGPKISSKIAKI